MMDLYTEYGLEARIYLLHISFCDLAILINQFSPHTQQTHSPA